MPNLCPTSVNADDLEIHAIHAAGPGGQNVNKVSSAIHLRFDIPNSSLPEACKQRLLALKDKRINRDGILIIKAQRFRTQEKNRADAIERLEQLLQKAGHTQRKRIPTKPTRASKQRRLNAKTQRSQLKKLRGKVVD